MIISNIRLIDETGGRAAGGASYKRIYQCSYTEGFTVAGFIANTETLLPKFGDTLNNPTTPSTTVDTSVYVSAVDIEAVEKPPAPAGEALYTVTYEGITWQERNKQPEDRAPEIEWSGTELTEVRRYDIDGIALTNSAGKFFEDLPAFYVRGADCIITRNELDNPASTIVEFSYTTNDSTWNGVATGKAKIGKISAQQVTENCTEGSSTATTYWKVSYPISFRDDPQGWSFITFDYGYAVIDEDTGLVLNGVPDKNGNYSSEPIFLDGSGGYASDQTEPTMWPDPGGEAGFIIYRETDFDSLFLPDPFA